MRFWFSMLLTLALCPVVAKAQQPGRDFNSGSVPHHSIPIPPIGNEFGDRHRGYGPNPAWGYGGYYGPGYGPSFGVTYASGPFGYSSSGYTSFSYGVPGFGVGYSAPLFGNSYYAPAWGYPGWNAPVYAPAPVYYTSPPPALPTLPQWMLDEAQVDQNVGRKAKPLSQTHRSLIQPSTPEAQLRSVRMQDVGDRLLVKLDYAAAVQSYAKSIQAAPDRPAPYVRLAMAKAARGDFRGAVAYLKHMADVDPTYPSRADSLEKMLGDQNSIAKIQLKQKVADWTKTDVYDGERDFLLGVMLFLDGDDRFRILLETAVKLDGDQPHLRAFLDATPPQGLHDLPVVAPTPDEIDALAAPPVGEPQPVVPRPLQPLPAPSKLPKPPLLLPQKLPEPPTP